VTRVLLVAAGGAIGAVARYAIAGLAHSAFGASFPYGTLAVNLIGCFFVGACMTAFEGRLGAPPEVRAFLVVGILGGLTTFSAFGYETHALLRDREATIGLWNVVANVGLGLGAVAFGRAVASHAGLA
jgi:CrcB protein